jgi:diaminopimelate decarboxylase
MRFNTNGPAGDGKRGRTGGEGLSGDAELVRRYGSPLYVYELDAVGRALLDLRTFLPGGATLFYSLKANPHPDLVRELRTGGCGAEVSSAGELAAALSAGFTGADCLYTGPAKSLAEIAGAVHAGVHRFSVESVMDFHRVARVAAGVDVTVDCLIRIATSAAGASGLRMTGGPTQFGVDAAQVLADPASFSALPGARVVGVHFFPLSNARDEDSLIAEFSASIALAARLRRDAGLSMSYVDLGGGFAAPFAQPGERPRYPNLRRSLEDCLDEHLPGWREDAPAIAFESGRHLVGDCGRLVCTAVEAKRRDGRTFVLLDGGINHLGGLSGIGRMLPAAAPLPSSRAAGEPGAATLVGPLCTPADVLARAAPVGQLEPGDPVVFPNVGAYGVTASLVAFLSRATPIEVVLRGGDMVSASRLEVGRQWV